MPVLMPSLRVTLRFPSHGWRVLRFHSEAGSELSREIPTEIGNFHNVLTRLVIVGAPDVVGTIPTEIGLLTKLGFL